MKRFRKIVAVAVVAVICGCSADVEQASEEAPNHEWHIVVAGEGLSKESLLTIGREVQDLIGHRAAPGDVVNVIRAPSHETVFSLTVPMGHAKVRLRSPAVKSIQSDIKSVFAPESVNTEAVARVRLPDLAAAIASRQRTSFTTRVIIFGSPLYSEPRYSDWVMKDGKFPSDGTLTAAYSPFNVEGAYPDGTQISWWVPESQWGMHSQYEDAVTRFNRLMVQRQNNAKIIRVSSDASMAFSFDNPQFTQTVELRDEPAVMKQFNVAPKPVIRQVASSGDTEDVESVLAAAEQDRDTIALAIEWISQDPNCDLDLWTECKGHPKKMYYGNMTTAFGELFRDVLRSSSSISGADADYRGMEWQRINHNRIDDLGVWIHVYRSSKPAVVRVIFVSNGERTEKTIRIQPANKWNRLDLKTGWLARRSAD